MPSTQPMFVSIVMPVRNEARTIGRCLRAVLEQDYPADYLEIVIADGMSDDGTCEIVRQIAARALIIPNHSQTQAAGLNAALQAAQGEVIVRIDGHTIVAPDYVRQCVNVLNTSGADCVGGGLNMFGTTATTHAIAAASRSPFFVPSHFRVRQHAAYTDTVYMGAYRRSTLVALGGYDEALLANEDYELNVRLRTAGGKIYFDPRIRSCYMPPSSIAQLARKYFRYGYWKTRTLAKHPVSVRLRHLAAPVLVLLLFAGAVPGSSGVSIILIGAYILLCLLATLRSQQPLGVALRMPLVFVVVHLMWGLGFWAGVGREIGRGVRRSLS